MNVFAFHSFVLQNLSGIALRHAIERAEKGIKTCFIDFNLTSPIQWSSPFANFEAESKRVLTLTDFLEDLSGSKNRELSAYLFSDKCLDDHFSCPCLRFFLQNPSLGAVAHLTNNLDTEFSINCIYDRLEEIVLKLEKLEFEEVYIVFPIGFNNFFREVAERHPEFQIIIVSTDIPDNLIEELFELYPDANLKERIKVALPNI